VRFEGNANIIAHLETIGTSEQAQAATATPLPESDEALINAVCCYIDERLTPQTSRIIKMHYNEEKSYKEISNSLGISLSAVNKHIVQGLRKLRSTFKRREA
jgi:RNA polymerase sigma-70 factor (ECF subfamily)